MAKPDTTDIQPRAAKRHKVLKSGKILAPGNLTVLDCTIRDMSETGARINAGNFAAVPNEFRLVVPKDDLMREARVVWRKGETVGVAFIGEAKRAPPRKW